MKYNWLATATIRACKPASLLLMVVIIGMVGCSPGYRIDRAIAEYNSAMKQIQIGDSRNKVIPILDSTQQNLDPKNRKNPDQLIKRGKKIFIYYARTGRQPDGLSTDDEFTPYVFVNDKLQSIGWHALGGPKSQGQARDVVVVY